MRKDFWFIWRNIHQRLMDTGHKYLWKQIRIHQAVTIFISLHTPKIPCSRFRTTLGWKLILGWKYIKQSQYRQPESILKARLTDEFDEVWFASSSLMSLMFSLETVSELLNVGRHTGWAELSVERPIVLLQLKI